MPPPTPVSETRWFGWKLGALGAGEDSCVIVEAVVRASPAASAGIQPGDQILLVDGHSLRAANDSTSERPLLWHLIELLNDRPLDQRMLITLKREAEKITLSLPVTTIGAAIAGLSAKSTLLADRLAVLDDLAITGQSEAESALLELYRDASAEIELRVRALEHLKYIAGLATLATLRLSRPEGGRDSSLHASWRDAVLAAEERLEQGVALADLGRVMSWIRDRYIDPERVHVGDLTQAAIRGMLESLDTYCELTTPDELHASRQNRYSGIGLLLETRDGRHLVWRVYSDSAASKVLAPDDEVIAVDDVSVAGRERADVIERVRGPAGTSVTLTIRRPGAEKTIAVEIVREEIQRPIVAARVLPGTIGYLSFKAFSAHASEQVQAEVLRLAEEGARALILDLRGNRGGAVEEVQRVAGIFLGADVLVAVSEGRPDFFPRRELKTSAAAVQWPAPRPLIVLVDGDTASAAEMLAGALLVHGRAELVGQKTFGKGVGQSTFDLAGVIGRRYLRLTTFAYHLPDDRAINGCGIQVQHEIPAFGSSATIAAELFKLRLTGAMAAYVKTHLHDDVDRLAATTFYSGAALDQERFPGFDDWFAGLSTSLDRVDAREGLRQYLRLITEHRLRTEFDCDLEGDRQLHAAIGIVATAAGLDLSSEPAYAGLLTAQAPAPR